MIYRLILINKKNTLRLQLAEIFVLFHYISGSWGWLLSRVGRGKRDRFTVAGRKRPMVVEFSGIRERNMLERHIRLRFFRQMWVCVRVARLPLPLTCRRERSFRVFTIEIHERENKKKNVYALQTTWRNSGPRIAYSTSRRPNRDSRKNSMCVR